MNVGRWMTVAAVIALGTVGCGNGAAGGDGGGGGGVPRCETESRECDVSADSMKIQYCSLDENGEEQWTACCDWSENPNASPQCECPAPWSGEEEFDCDTPLVLAFGNEAVNYTTEMAGSFDLTGRGMSVASDWPTAQTPWLALDRNGNGLIDDGGELFGSATLLANGRFATNGFAALAELDADRNGRIDSEDPAFARLVLWRDNDASRSCDAGELTPASSEVLSIDLTYTSAARCNERGNCEVERAEFRAIEKPAGEHTAHSGAADVGRVGTVIDVHLRRW